MTRQNALTFGIVCLLAACETSIAQNVVRPGIDVLLTDSIHLIRERRIGLLTNQTGVDRHGVDDVTRLVQADIDLTTLFSPEHGFRGLLDEENVGHSVDSATGIPIYSLYGDVRAPTIDMLEDVDVLLIDLQDIGSRTYTYVSTAILAVNVAASIELPVLILDRPNPIGGVFVQGPVPDQELSSFVGMLRVPLRHGMTIGELVRFANAQAGGVGDVTVIPADGWERSVWFDETGLPWVNPSPNMPSLESATHYPGTVLFEATNLSVGRGTPIAFQVLGAPWLDARRLVGIIDVPTGVRLTDTIITPLNPTDGKLGGESFPAIRLLVTDRDGYDPVRLAAEILSLIRQEYPDSLAIRDLRMDQLAGTDAIRTGRWPPSGVQGEGTGLSAFRALVAPYLLY